MWSPRRREDAPEPVRELGGPRRVDQRVLEIIAGYSEAHGRELYVLDPERAPRRLGNHRRRRS